MPYKNVNSVWTKKLSWPSQNVKIHMRKYHNPWNRNFLNRTLKGIDQKRDNFNQIKNKSFC